MCRDFLSLHLHDDRYDRRHALVSVREHPLDIFTDDFDEVFFFDVGHVAEGLLVGGAG